MTLKTDYNIDTQMNSVFDLGKSLIVNTPTASFTVVQAALQAAALRGETEFTVNLAHNANNASLELQGRYYETYAAGVIASLSEEDVYDYEVTISLNTTIAGTATLDLQFNFKCT